MSSQSSLAPTTTTATPDSSSAIASSTSTGNSGPGGTSTPLYLFTFLATLFVLLAVSCAIVLRSFYLRRQLRRRYEAAIAAGLLPPNVLPGHHAGGRKKRDFGEKPKLYDAAVVPSFGEKWEYIVPVSAKVAKPPSQEPTTPSNDIPTRFAALRQNIVRSVRLPRRRADSPTQDVDLSGPPEDPLVDANNVQVSVLIAMPHPHGAGRRMSMMSEVSLKGKGRMSGSWEDEEEGEGVPDVVIGVSQVSLKKDQLP